MGLNVRDDDVWVSSVVRRVLRAPAGLLVDMDDGFVGPGVCG